MQGLTSPNPTKKDASRLEHDGHFKVNMARASLSK